MGFANPSPAPLRPGVRRGVEVPDLVRSCTCALSQNETFPQPVSSNSSPADKNQRAHVVDGLRHSSRCYLETISSTTANSDSFCTGLRKGRHLSLSSGGGQGEAQRVRSVSHLAAGATITDNFTKAVLLNNCQFCQSKPGASPPWVWCVGKRDGEAPDLVSP
jgi:hypothetical protein